MNCKSAQGGRWRDGYPTDDAGLTLVELLIYLFVSALFLSLLAMLLVNGLKAQAQTTDRDSATGSAGVVSSSILGSVRNASEFVVRDSGTTLIAKVATGATGWQCRAWALVGDEVRFRSSTTPISTTNTSTWGVIADGAAATLPAGAAFATDGARGVDIGLRITRAETTVSLTNGVTAQAVTTGTVPTTSCW